MKTTTPAVTALLASFSPAADFTLYCADLFTITLQAGSCAGIATGQQLAYTSSHFPVLWNSLIYLANSIQVEGLKLKQSISLNADQQQITLAGYQDMTIGGIPFLQALQQGLLDGAEIRRERAFFATFSGGGTPALAPVPPLVPLGTVIMFKGRVTEINGVGRSSAKVTVASDLTLLDKEMPWKSFGASCQWQLYGPDCTLSRAAFTFTGAAGAGSTQSVVNWASASTNFQQGSITFTSGVNEGITATIKSASASALTLVYPLPTAPAAGDGFTAVWGCDHTPGANFTGSISTTTLNVSASTGLFIDTNNALLLGAGVAAGTLIVAQLTGVQGGPGTYTVNISQTVASGPMSSGQGCAKFNNLANYEGFPFIPPPQIVTGPLSTTADASKG